MAAVLVFLLTGVFGSSTALNASSAKSDGADTEIIFLNKPPRAGLKIKVDKKPEELILTTHSQIDPAYTVAFEGVLYKVAITADRGDDGKARYGEVSVKKVFTYDKTFKTPEGLKIGDTLEKVLTFTGDAPYLEPGWGFYVKLPSGWYACFGMKDNFINEDNGPTLKPDAEIGWFVRY